MVEESTVSVDIRALQEKLERETNKRQRFYSLTLLSGVKAGRRIKLDEDRSYVMGRSDVCNIQLDEQCVSREHALIHVKQKGILVVEDRGSRNGTFINGKRLDSNASSEIFAGDKVRLGEEVLFRIDLVDEQDDEFFTAMYDAAVKDPLTKSFNKRYLLENLQRELALSQRHNIPLSLIIFDVDFFKKVNDTYGHLAGDLVLARLGQIVATALRVEDLLCRYGGEEFVVVVKSQGLLAAGQLAERLRQLVERAEIAYEGRRIPVTISLGVASTSVKTYGTPEALIEDADRMLYEAKRRGRNRVQLIDTKKVAGLVAKTA